MGVPMARPAPPDVGRVSPSAARIHDEKMLKGVLSLKPRSSASRVLARRETMTAYLFLLPSLVFFLGFVVFPMITCIGYSFTNATMNSKTAATTFVGLRNFIGLNHKVKT